MAARGLIERSTLAIGSRIVPVMRNFISREEMSSRPVPGQISGYVNVYGSDPANPQSYRGELDFDLDQASLVDIPLLDELDRSLGSTQGGVFDDGDVHGTIADRKVIIQALTLVGPLAQVHSTGTVDFLSLIHI